MGILFLNDGSLSITVKVLVRLDRLFHPVLLVLLRISVRCYVKGQVSLLVISVGGYTVLVDLGRNVTQEIHCFAVGRLVIRINLLTILRACREYHSKTSGRNKISGLLPILQTLNFLTSLLSSSSSTRLR